MQVTRVTAGRLDVPLDTPVRNGTATIRSRDYVLVRVEGEAGLVGVGHGLARGGDLVGAVASVYGPRYVGRDVAERETVRQELYRATETHLGRSGAYVRALSLVDVALWDLHAKSLGCSIAAMLGAGSTDAVPALAASGYYRFDDEAAELDGLRAEYASLVENGYERVKIMVGGASPDLDAARVTVAATEARGARLSLDVNGGWGSAADASRLLHGLPAAHVDFVEEPFRPDHDEAVRQLRRMGSWRVAMGEWEAGTRAFHRLLASGLVDIVRVDATVAGGITEWLRIAALAAVYDVEVLPHYFPELHSQLVPVAETARSVEVIPTSSGAENFHKLLRAPLSPDKGRFPVSSDPGFGIAWNWDHIESFTVETA